MTTEVQFPTRADLALSVPPGGTMVELGVAAGMFACVLMARNPRARYIGIDRYTDHHGEREYRAAKDRIKSKGGKLLRATFSDALRMFTDDFNPLIYVDGYAHTGQEEGRTLRDWWPKVKPGGIFAGHDYHPTYQATIDAVDAFVAEHGLTLNIIEEKPFPSWWVRKPE